MSVKSILVSFMEEFLRVFLDDFQSWGFFWTEVHFSDLIDFVFNVFLSFHFVSRGFFRGFGGEVDVLLVFPFAFTLDHGAIVLFDFLVVEEVFDEFVEFFFGEEFVGVFDDSVGFDVEFGDVEGQFVLFAEHALLETVLNLFFEHASDWMCEKLGPINAFFRVDNEHFPEDVLNEGMGFSRESQRLVLDFLQQVNDVTSRVRHPE